jgi:hypothetical protein
MLKTIILIGYTVANVNGFLEREDKELNNLLAQSHPSKLTIHHHPRVQSAASCSRTLNMLKAGPANIPEEQHWGTSDSNYKFVDHSFKGKVQLYEAPYTA